MTRTIAVLDLQFPTNPALPDLVSTLLDDLAPAAIHEIGPESAPTWRVFFSSAAARNEAERVIRECFSEKELGLEPGEVADEDWAERSQAGLRAVRIGRIVVAPPWDVPQELDAADRLIVIKPSMGFGTGHHATTRLCLELLQQIDCRGRRVLDIGTGSGVLAIAAGVLGAAEVTALDIDPDAIANAEENIHENRVTGRINHGVQACLGDFRDSQPRTPADIVLANLTGATLAASARELAGHACSEGRLVLSGFLVNDTDEVLRAFAAAAVCRMVAAEAEWRAALLEMRSR